MREVLKLVFGPVAQTWASAKSTIYRSESELTDEAISRLPDPGDLRAIGEVDIHVRTKASHPRLGEFFSRQVLASITVELDEEAPSYDIVRLQRKLRETDIPIVQVFGDTLVSRGALGLNEILLLSGRDDSSFEVLVKLGSDVGDVERWIRDLDEELSEHLREVDNNVGEGYDREKYDHSERIATSITAHLERASQTTAFDKLLTQLEKDTDDVTVFRRYEPDWYLERVGGSNLPDTTILTVSHRYRIDNDWRVGVGTDEKEITDTEAALRWLREFRDDPPDYFDTQ